jgi:penicillin-binding protein A
MKIKRMRLRRFLGMRSGALVLFLGLCVLSLYQFITLRKETHSHRQEEERKLTLAQISAALKDENLQDGLPTKLNLKDGSNVLSVFPEYTIDPDLQESMVKLFKQYNPDYGAFVAIEAQTGKVLSLISYNPKDPGTVGHFALRATFPSASVFKVVTAAAAIAERKLHPDSLISFNGRSHTLYKSQLFKEQANRWTRTITLKEAFAKSVNTVFGKIGVFNLGPSELKTYADRFGFNRPILSDLPFEAGKATISEDPFEVAESASGYTLENRMSPIQGALIASTIVNDGMMMSPYIVEKLRDEKGEVVFMGLPHLAETVLDATTADQMKELFRETVRAGTSQKSFRGFSKGSFSDMDVGGKTGSLTGDEPEGKYDWFVGYGRRGNTRVAFASLTISKAYWKVKSAYLTRRAIESYFKGIEKGRVGLAGSSTALPMGGPK